jgi:hypothetical protein
MTHSERIEQSILATADKRFLENQWGARHSAAFRNPRCDEAIVGLIRSAAAYADQHQRRFESRIGEDGCLGEYWADIVRGIRGLLNGECGRLDCGTLDCLILDMLHAEGIEE